MGSMFDAFREATANDGQEAFEWAFVAFFMFVVFYESRYVVVHFYDMGAGWKVVANKIALRSEADDTDDNFMIGVWMEG